MEKAKRFFLFLVLAAIVGIGQGCAAYRTGIPEASKAYEPREGGTLIARLTMNAEHWANGQRYQQSHKDCLKRHQEVALKVFGKSGLFKEVGPDVTDPDIEIVVTSKEEELYNNVLVYVSGFTLGVIPAWITVANETDVKVATPNGKSIADFSAQSRMRAIIQILLFPAIPTLHVAGSRCTRDLYRSVAVEMSENPSIKELLCAKQKGRE